MSTYLPLKELRTAGRKTHKRSIVHTIHCLSRSTSTSAVNPQSSKASEYASQTIPAVKVAGLTGLERLPTTSILRNIFLGTFFTSPILYKPGFALLRKIANSNSRFLSPDVNPLLRRILKPVLYDAFCAGTNLSEICQTRDAIKGVGYSGIILCYGKEIQISKANKLHSTGVASKQDAEIAHWRDGNLETLDMVGQGDWLGMKFTGAGSMVTTALMNNADAPSEFLQAMDAICQKAEAQGCRLWVDAEQQILQKSIDRWTIDLMRKYNQHGKVVVYNTLQAYLKASRTKLEEQLALSHREGWSLAIKIVRGAYIDSDPRELIHDTKQDTDVSYDTLVRDLLSGTNLGFSEASHPKNVKLFIAGHNPDSVGAAMNLMQSLHASGRLRVVPDFGQLQGMGDVLGCKVLQQCENLEAEKTTKRNDTIVPKVFKCLTWGSVQECMQYLFRRAVENSGGTDRMRDGLSANIGELRRRALRPITGT